MLERESIVFILLAGWHLVLFTSPNLEYSTHVTLLFQNKVPEVNLLMLFNSLEVIIK
jgi:succinate dehydrogenase hydrophobic anchor subunit